MSEPPKGLILIVDDVLENLQVLSSVLRQANYQITAATNGEKALGMLEKSNPDLILLDVMMPGMTGFEVCEKIRQQDRLKNTPIIFLTAKTEQEDILKGFESGAVDYVTKPFQFPELLARVATHVELKRSREQLLSSHQQLQKLNQEKDEFLRIASHDMSNSLNVIKLTARMVKLYVERYSHRQISEKMDTIESTVGFMNDMITNLVNIDAIEAGSFLMKPEDLELNQLTRTLVDNYAEVANQKGIRLNYQPASEEVLIHSDKNATLRILENLVSNAIKYSESGTQVWVRVSDSQSPDYAVQVEVEDQGPGLSQEDHARLFGKFARLSAQPTNGENSVGLGLYIAKKVIDSMGGKIWCNSELNQGSTFGIAWPRSIP
ncbi:MAG: response regulator [Candidatus Sericytochromatia bacterium]